MTTFRDLTVNDLEELLRWRNDPEVNRCLMNRAKTKADAEAWFIRIKSNPKNLLKGVVQDESLVGYCIVEDVDEQNLKSGVGIIIRCLTEQYRSAAERRGEARTHA